MIKTGSALCCYIGKAELFVSKSAVSKIFVSFEDYVMYNKPWCLKILLGDGNI